MEAPEEQVIDDWRERTDGAGISTTSMDERTRQRAQERERRAQERLAATHMRAERRIAEREQASLARQEAREARRLENASRRQPSPAAPIDNTDIDIAPKRRRSGAAARNGEPRIERDTSNYRTVVDTSRIRALFERGIPVASLAQVFGITVDDVEAALAAP